MVKWRNLCSNWQIVVVVYPGAGGREKKKKEKKKERKKAKREAKAASALPSPPKKKRKTRERKFGGTNQISFFREIFLSQGEREREREGEIHLSLHATFINTLVTEEIYKARTKCNRSPHPTPFLRRARSAPSDLRTL